MVGGIERPFGKSRRCDGLRRGSFPLDTISDVARHRDRSDNSAVGREDERERHLQIDLTSAFVQAAGQGRAALKLKDAIRHRRVEAAPVRGAEMWRNDEVETLSERLAGGETEQRDRKSVV